MIKVEKVKDNLLVSFDYDANIVEKIKSLPTRKYIADMKSWQIPQHEIKDLINLFGDDLDIAEDVDINYERPKYDFKAELETIGNKQMRVFAKWCLEMLPDYFYKVPASSSGKYHPQYALGEGGLVRHTQAAVRIANELFNNHTIQNFTDEEKDIMRVALLIHDGVKQGADGTGHTTTTHPLEVVEYIEDKYYEVPEETLPDEVLDLMEDRYLWEDISNCIKSHMGEWNTDYENKEEVLPKPETEMEKFTHLCDYLASRKMLEVNFDVEG